MREKNQVGRPKGSGKNKLDGPRDEIVALIKTGSRRSYIAKRYGTTDANLLHWLRSRGLCNVEEEY